MPAGMGCPGPDPVDSTECYGSGATSEDTRATHRSSTHRDRLLWQNPQSQPDREPRATTQLAPPSPPGDQARVPGIRTCPRPAPRQDPAHVGAPAGRCRRVYCGLGAPSSRAGDRPAAGWPHRERLPQGGVGTGVVRTGAACVPGRRRTHPTRLGCGRAARRRRSGAGGRRLDSPDLDSPDLGGTGLGGSGGTDRVGDARGTRQGGLDLGPRAAEGQGGRPGARRCGPLRAVRPR